MNATSIHCRECTAYSNVQSAHTLKIEHNGLLAGKNRERSSYLCEGSMIIRVNYYKSSRVLRADEFGMPRVHILRRKSSYHE
eukprot:SAG31_NODE_2340_length_5920_cov_4.296561_6_plen_82_part_00